MRGLTWAALALCAGLGVWLWGFGVARDVAVWAAEGQRDVQGGMAGYLRALRRGDTGAFMGLMGLCFAYGFFHAAGPGHGKLLIGGYGLASRVSAIRLSALAVASSLAQSLTAVALVAAGYGLLKWNRSYMTDLADQFLAAASAGAIALVGLWLALRGLRDLRARAAHQHNHDHAHDHTHDHGHDHSSCGHAHGPSPEDMEKISGFKDAVLLIGAIAIRPCTGALFLLIITFGMGIAASGIAGALIMGLGTASVTVLVALASTRLRVAVLGQMESLPWAAGVLQLGFGLLIALVAGQIALAML